MGADWVATYRQEQWELLQICDASASQMFLGALPPDPHVLWHALVAAAVRGEGRLAELIREDAGGLRVEQILRDLFPEGEGIEDLIPQVGSGGTATPAEAFEAAVGAMAVFSIPAIGFAAGGEYLIAPSDVLIEHAEALAPLAASVREDALGAATMVAYLCDAILGHRHGH